LREQTRTFAYVRDLTSAVRGGRIPAWAMPITRWLRLVPMIRIGGGDGRMHIIGVGRDQGALAERFVARILRTIDRKLKWRAQVMHCDNPREGALARQALIEQLPGVECAELLEAGSAIGAHAGAGAIVVSLMPNDARDDMMR
jgi:uncharacterized protein